MKFEPASRLRTQAARSMGVEMAVTPAIRSFGRIAQFSGQLQHHVSAQRKAGQEDRALGACERPDHRQQIGRLAGMIERLPLKMFGAAAASHVEAMRGETGFERGLRQAARIARGAGSFQSMHQNQLGEGSAGRTLRMDQHLDARLGVIEFRFDRKALLVQTSRRQ